MTTITTKQTASPLYRSVHRPEKARYQIREEGQDVIVSCQYWEVRHAKNLGGNISSVIFPHGSGKNIFAAPFSTQIRRGGAWQADTFDNTLDTNPVFSCRQEGELVRVESRARLLSKDGKQLPAECVHSFVYHPWGYIRQSVTIDFPQPTAEIWNLRIARAVVAAHLDEFAYRPSWENATEWRRHCSLGSWYKLDKGESFRDYLAVETAEIPLYLMFLQRGVEGFDWFCGENLDQWHAQLADIPHLGKFRVVYNDQVNGYEVDLSPLDNWTSSLELQGKYTFDFFMALPFVQEYVRPLLRGGGGSRTKEFVLGSEQIAKLAEHHVQILRHHDDGPKPDGIFWRDGAYPPYPPQQMQQLDACIAELHQHGIMVTPYFSLHEWHPEAPQFAEKAEHCKRTINNRGAMIHNPTPLGEFGAQMCLHSDWEQILKGNIDRVLSHHAFDGVYFDWTRALPCLNKQHCAGGHVHWDIEGFIRILEWTRERVGPEGMMYLHMSLEPFIVAENLANVVLVYESPGPRRPTRDMFPPIAEFMKTCSHFVLTTAAQHSDPRRFLLYSLLSHVTVDYPTQEFLAAHTMLAKIDFTKYRSFADYRRSPVTTSSPDILSATYWNENEALVLLANLSDQKVTFRWDLDPAQIGWKQENGAKRRSATLDPLSFRYIPVARV